MEGEVRGRQIEVPLGEEVQRGDGTAVAQGRLGVHFCVRGEVGEGERDGEAKGQVGQGGDHATRGGGVSEFSEEPNTPISRGSHKRICHRHGRHHRRNGSRADQELFVRARQLDTKILGKIASGFGRRRKCD